MSLETESLRRELLSMIAELRDEQRMHVTALDRCADRLDKLEARTPNADSLADRLSQLTTERDRWRRLHDERTVKLGELEDRLDAVSDDKIADAVDRLACTHDRDGLIAAICRGDWRTK